MSTLSPSAGTSPSTEAPAGSNERGPRRAGRVGIGLALLAAIALVVFGVVTWANRPTTKEASVTQPHLMSMQESAQAMQQTGAVMQRHGQEMLDQGQRTGDQDLIAHGQHWLSDGQTLMQSGQWMAMNPTAPGSLVAGATIDTGNRGALDRSVQAMMTDPSKATGVDMEALRWTGMAMQEEGQNMAAHAQIMAEEVELMIERHGLQGQAADDLRQAVQTMREVSGRMKQNGQEMMDYADRIRRSMGK